MELAAYESMRDSEEHHWWFVGRRAIIRSLIDRLTDLPENAAILEAGCGFGGNLSLLAEYGALRAFEYDDVARAYSSQRSGLPVSFGALPDSIGFDGELFDLVALFDVLEHIDDDVSSLRSLSQRLNDNGSILLTVPAVPQLWSHHDEIHHHKRRYTKKSLEGCIAQAGLVLDEIGYFNALLFPLAVMQRIAARVGLRQGDPNAMPAPALNRVLQAIFAKEVAVLPRLRFPIGLSLYASVRKCPRKR